MHLGIITCEILRREIYEVIKWTGIKRVFMVLPESTNPVITVAVSEMNARFLTEFAGDGDIILREKRLESIKKEIKENNLSDSVIIKLTELRLHDYPDKLRATIEEWVRELSPVVDLILLGYGLCGSTPVEMEELITKAEADVDVPVVIPRGGGGEILNNCIEIAVGKDKVQALLREERGTFFMTPAGASIIEEPQVILERGIEIMSGGGGGGFGVNRNRKGDTSAVLKLLKNHYKRVIKVCYSDADESDEEFNRVVRNFASEFGLVIESVRGSSRAVLDALRPFFHHAPHAPPDS